jgi:hypothetical protein
VPYRPFGSRTNNEIEAPLLSAGVMLEDLFSERPTPEGVHYLKGLSPVDWVKALSLARERGVISCSPKVLDRSRSDWSLWREFIESKQYRRVLAVHGEFGSSGSFWNYGWTPSEVV